MWFKTDFVYLALHLIEEEPLFRFTDEDSAKMEVLKHSLTRVGVLSPIIVQPGKRYKIVNGFKRFSVAKELGLPSIPARVLKEKLSFRQILTVALFAHARPLSLTEKARVIKILVSFGLSPERVLQEYKDLLDIPSPHLLQLYLRISKYSPSLLSYISNHHLSLKQALVFDGLSSQEQELLLTIASSFNLKGYDLEDILTDLKEIATGEGKRVGEVLEELELSSLLKNTGLTRSQKIERMKRIIKARKFPLLTRVNARLTELKKKLKLGPQIKVSWDQKLEERGLKITLRITHPTHIQELLGVLSTRENPLILSRMLEVYYEGLPDKESMD